MLRKVPNGRIWLRKYPQRPIPVAARSKALVCGRSPAGIAGSNPVGAWMFVCCECCVMSGKVTCDEPIPRPEETYRLSVCVSL